MSVLKVLSQKLHKIVITINPEGTQMSELNFHISNIKKIEASVNQSAVPNNTAFYYTEKQILLVIMSRLQAAPVNSGPH